MRLLGRLPVFLEQRRLPILALSRHFAPQPCRLLEFSILARQFNLGQHEACVNALKLVDCPDIPTMGDEVPSFFRIVPSQWSSKRARPSLAGISYSNSSRVRPFLGPLTLRVALSSQKRTRIFRPSRNAKRPSRISTLCVASSRQVSVLSRNLRSISFATTVPISKYRLPLSPLVIEGHGTMRIA